MSTVEECSMLYTMMPYGFRGLVMWLFEDVTKYLQIKNDP